MAEGSIRRTRAHPGNDYRQSQQEDYAGSLFQSYRRGARPLNSVESVADKLESVQRPENGLLFADLSYFEIYREPGDKSKAPAPYAYELTSLHRFEERGVHLRVDGRVSYGRSRFLVQRLPIAELQIDRQRGPTVRVSIRITSTIEGEGPDVWLLLKEPSSTYKRFYEPFLWLAALTKDVIKYLGKTENRALRHFRGDAGWGLIDQSNKLSGFKQGNHRPDLRIVLNAHINFIWKQIIGAPKHLQNHLKNHQLWADLMQDGHKDIVERPEIVKETVITPHVYDCWKESFPAKYLKEVYPIKPVRDQQRMRKKQLGLAEGVSTRSLSNGSVMRKKIANVEAGDVISFVRTKTRSGNPNSPVYYGLVQRRYAYSKSVERCRQHVDRLDILRIYQPNETFIGSARYPVSKELFLTDKCNCKGNGEKDEWNIYISDVLEVHSVDWKCATLNTTEDFMIRQTYLTESKAFITLEDIHMKCRCHKSSSAVEPVIYDAGDTVYIRCAGSKRLVPAIIWEQSPTTGSYTVKVLKPLEDYASLASAAGRNHIFPNELVLTDTLEIDASWIQRRCNIRFMDQSTVTKGKIPFPYDRVGTGDFCFLSMTLSNTGGDEKLLWMTGPPPRMKAAPSLPQMLNLLIGLSTFGGGGAFDRGQEEAGAVHFRDVLELSRTAIHTHRENSQGTTKVCYYCGSVNDYLGTALTESSNALIAKIGNVEDLLIGSGYSGLQHDRGSDRSQTNASLVTTFCSFVDLFSPLYGVLENVKAIGHNRYVQSTAQDANDGVEEYETVAGTEDDNTVSGTEEDETVAGTEEDETKSSKARSRKVLSQMVACLVSMGYQVNHFLMKSEEYGSCQRRWRTIVTIAAPGLTPIAKPPLTHGKLETLTATNSTGDNHPEDDQCSYVLFRQLSFQDGDQDLPDIGTGTPQICPCFPDHRLANELTGHFRSELAQIPLNDPTQPDQKSQRLRKDDLMPTVRTKSSIQSITYGRSVHYCQNRLLSVQEARRAQGWPDDEVALGSPIEQYKTIGNGVDRSISFALGLSIRQSVMKDAASNAIQKLRSKKRRRISKREIASLNSIQSEAEVCSQGYEDQTTPKASLKRTRTSSRVSLPSR
ncbi:hypothetical protein OPT61_g6832 [Boeremia exigua]|uniref:Uncharacterized protein n=1 Tax=Boeremia exigua TaxID=749465 RepID=A0ACC2I4L6_9PLEO|nr:hypothetical protein OPT61_g6832 [Boeremia exigua]